MSDGTHISWTDATWNVVTGCTKISPGCDHCYIDRTPPFRMAHRRFQHPDPVNGSPTAIGATTGVTLHEDRLTVPLRWRKPRRVFVCSLADLVHDDVPDEYIARVWAVMAMAPQHTFQVLTKRHARLRALLSADDFWRLVGEHGRALAYDRVYGKYRGTSGPMPLTDDSSSRGFWQCVSPLPNVWVGVTVESQQWADLRIPALLDTPAAVRWVSAEPLLGPLNLARYLRGVDGTYGSCGGRALDWVVAGGESGPGARPAHPDWFRSLSVQCDAASVPFHFKQWGAWAPSDNVTVRPNAVGMNPRGLFGVSIRPGRETVLSGQPMVRVGAKAAGRALDGKIHDAYPGERPAVGMLGGPA